MLSQSTWRVVACRVAFAVVAASCWATSAQGELLVFTASWCKVCRMMDSTVHRMLDDGLPVREVDVDQQAELASRYQIRGVPTLILLDGEREIRRTEGLQSYGQLRAWFEQVGQLPEGAPRRPGAARDTTQRETVPRLQPAPLAAELRPVPTPPQHEESPLADGSLSRRTDPDPAVVQRAVDASVRLKVDDEGGHSYGSGTLIDVHGKHGLVVTCAHIFRDSQGKGPIHVDVFQRGAARTVPGQLVKYEMKQDIALVSIQLPFAMTPVPVAVHVKDIQKEDTVFSIGCDRGADPSVRPSHVVDINRYIDVENILIHGHPVDGRSGGGLFNVAGEIIGVCNAADHERDEGLYASLPVIHRILDQANLASVYQRRPGGTAGRDVGSERMSGLASASEHDRAAPADAAQEQVRADVRPPAPRAAANGTALDSGETTEMICIIRSKHDPAAPAQVIVVNQPSQQVLEALRREGALRR